MDPYAHKPRPSKGDLLTSAKVVAGAAKATVSHGGAAVDKGKVAGAAANLLDAATHGGKGHGGYVAKAQGFLRTYESSHPPVQGSHVASHQAGGAPGSHGQGDYLKMAQGLLGGHSGGGNGSHSSGGGYGDFVNMAGGFLKKH